MDTYEHLETPPAGEESAAPPVEEEPAGDPGTPEEPELGDADAPPVEPSGGVQKRIDELVKQREDWRRQAEAWQQRAIQQQPAPEASPPADPGKPRSADFEDYDAYLEALAEYKAKALWSQQQQQSQAQARQQALAGWWSKAQEKHADFETVFHNNVPVSTAMVDLLLESDMGVDVAYHLGQNPVLANRLAGLPPLQLAREFGKLEANLSAKPPPQRSKTNAPAPTSPVGGKETPARKLEELDYDDFKKARERELYGE